MNSSKQILFLAFTIIYFSMPNQTYSQEKRVSKSDFGTLADGTKVEKFTLRNSNGMEVNLMTYGATITKISVPDKNGEFENIITGSENLDDYMLKYPAASAIGRFANRIERGQFSIDDKQYNVTINHGKNHIHGGNKGFAKVVWDAEILDLKDQPVGVRFSYFSKDGEEGFPGNLNVSVTYILSDDNELILNYEASTDKPTIVNLTNHAYFDLSGSSDISSHILQLNAGHYTPVNKELIPTGEIKSVKNTPFDFNAPLAINARLVELDPDPKKGYYDHNYVLRNKGKKMVDLGELYYPLNGRLMTVKTTLPGVQLYTGNKVGICLETQHYPNAINEPKFPSPIIRPNEPHQSTTIFGFSIR
jgi:aldose 1-epimerase